MHSLLLKLYYSSFSAIAASTFNWPMADILRKQGWIIWLTTPVFECDRKKKRKKKKGRHGKCSVKVHSEKYSAHGTWKEYGN